jgi:hypothetical protein
MMNERIKELAKEAGYYLYDLTETHECKTVETDSTDEWITLEKFAELIVRECIDKIETHRIPVGNSAAGEMACEWTYSALKEVRDEIKEHFGVKE